MIEAKKKRQMTECDDEVTLKNVAEKTSLRIDQFVNSCSVERNRAREYSDGEKGQEVNQDDRSPLSTRATKIVETP